MSDIERAVELGRRLERIDREISAMSHPAWKPLVDRARAERYARRIACAPLDEPFPISAVEAGLLDQANIRPTLLGMPVVVVRPDDKPH